MNSSKKILERLEVDKALTNRANPTETNLLLVGGTLHELNVYMSAGYGPPTTNIVTLNINSAEKATITGNIESITILPEKSFDVIYFSGVPANDIDMEKAFATAQKALKDDGLLFFKGMATVVQFTQNKNSLLTEDNKEIDISKMLINKQFPTVKKLRFLGNSFSQCELVASKKAGIDLVEEQKRFPVINKIIQDCTGMNYDNLNDSLQTDTEVLIEKINKHLDTKRNDSSIEEQQKVQVLSAAVHFLQGQMGIDEFNTQLSKNSEYNAGFFSKTAELVAESLSMKGYNLDDENKSSAICTIQ